MCPTAGRSGKEVQAGAKIDLRSLNIYGSVRFGPDCREKRSASRVLIESREILLRGLLPNNCLSTATRWSCLRIFLITNAKLLYGSMCLVPTKKSNVCG